MSQSAKYLQRFSLSSSHLKSWVCPWTWLHFIVQMKCRYVHGHPQNLFTVGTLGLKEFKGRNFQINGTGTSESAKSINKTAESFNILIYFKLLRVFLTVS